MAFVKAKIELSNPSVGTGVKVALKRIKAVSAKMSISVTGATVMAIGWADGDKLEVLLGDGEHHGLVRLRKNNSAGQAVVSNRKAVRGGSYLQIQLGHQPAFVNRAEAARWCQWEKVEDGWVEIVLPKWADETAPRKPATNGVTLAAPPAAPVRKVADVTAGLMGDPPPGRREMLAKMGGMKA